MEDQRQAAATGERVTQQFYHAFKGQRATFLAHIQYFNSTTPSAQCEQYASLLLHRLMFLYFLQKKGFLDSNPDYLRQALHHTQRQLGPDRFHTCFLLRLLHEGLNTARRTRETTLLLGRIPYLGDGFCTHHSIEQVVPTVLVPDQAFATLFAFFDTYAWRLDEQPFSSEQVVTPALAGAIFEQYSNQSHTGAYYTQSDITTYIANNTLIPALFDAVARVCPATFAPQAATWQLLKNHPDRYISIALRSEQPLPGETAREYRQRRMAYLTLKQSICAGQVTTVDDLITYNLDISHFAQDVIRDVAPMTMVSTCYEQLQRMTILDPTCGSGAFLLAALKVLVPLYEVCCERLGIQTDQPAQRQLAIHRAIMANNLHGIDIMEEGAEICKLLLFLTLVARAECSEDIEPLPNLDRHILVGNTLATLSHAADAPTGTALPSWYQALRPIIERGGFDVIIGNPPYVEYTKHAFPYTLHDFATLHCANLYTCVVERSHDLLAHHGRHGMVLPLAAFATKNMVPFIEGFRNWFPGSWLSFYHFRPSMLFSGSKAASIPIALYVARASGPERRFSTHLNKWTRETRHLLFSGLTYCQITTPGDPDNRHYYPKFGCALENSILTKVLQQEMVSRYLSPTPNQNTMFYRSAGGLYWKVFVNFAWPYATTSNKQCSFALEYDRDLFVALYNSSLFWWYYTVTCDSFNLKDYMLFGFRFSYPQDQATCLTLKALCRQLMANFQHHAQHRTRRGTGSYTIYARKAKGIIDQIDCVLAQLYSLNDEELDFILHYDLKYRLGSDGD